MSSVDEILAEAKAHHAAGRMSDAERLCLRALEIDPDRAEAHFQLGALAHSSGQFERAVASFDQAIRVNPQHSEAHHFKGAVLAQTGRLDEAIASLEQAYRLDPSATSVLGNLAHVMVARDKALGASLAEQGQSEQAAACYRRAIELAPNDAGLHNNLGILLQQQGHLAEAIDCYRRAIEIAPNDGSAHNNLGSALHKQGQAEGAIVSYTRAIELAPGDTAAHGNLATVLQEKKRFAEAAACYRRVLELGAGNADTHYDLAIALQRQDLFDEAEASYRQALALDPQHANALNNLGTLLTDVARFDEAAACYDRALELDPDHADAHYNRALVLLLLGDFAEGWSEYEWRFRVKNVLGALAQPRWNGETMESGTVLLRSEQGLGDAMQFIRYAEQVKRRVGTVVVECQRQLTRLLERCAGVDRVVVKGQPLPPFDAYAPLMSLPWIFGTTLENVPAGVPYLEPDAAEIERWKEELAGGGGFKVGIAWQGSPGYERDRFRSIPLEHFAPIAATSGVRLYSLQAGAGREQLAALAGRLPITDLGERLGDFCETAAIVRNLDLVITSDSASAHLAGALGVNVWVPLPFAPDWRWMLERSDTPWYPTMRLFRQSTRGDWPEVFRRIKAALADEIARTPRAAS